MAPEHRAVQHHPHDRGHEHQRDEGVRHAIVAPGRQPFQFGKADPKTKARRAVGGEPAGDAAVDQKAAQGDDEGLHLQPRDEKPVREADDAAQRDHQRDGQRPGDVAVGEQIDEQHAQQRDHRAGRQFDAPRDDDEGLADREQAEQADQIGGVGDVDRRQEQRVDRRHHRADRQNENDKPNVLAQHALPLNRPRPAPAHCVR